MSERIRAFYVIVWSIDMIGLINSDPVSLQCRRDSCQYPDFQHFGCHVIFIRRKR